MTPSRAPLILILDDEEPIRTTLSALLEGEGFRVAEAASLRAGLAGISQGPLPDAALLDVFLPDGTGLDLLSALLDLKPGLPAIMISGKADIGVAVEATRRGAFDFLEKPLSAERVILTLRNALQMKELAQENRELREAREGPGELIARSAPMTDLLAKLALVAPRHVPVLITGASGTGKEHVAHILHERGPYAGGPFVKLNAAAIPADLMESTLFGHEKGAFTSAVARHRGLVEEAHHGTLFLDEIGEMPLALQARLLRVIEEGRVRRVGGEKEIPAEPRIIAATNRDLPRDVEEGRFRLDLYHRLAVIVLCVPALRERREDVGPLAGHFVHSFCEKEHLRPRALCPEAIAFLEAQAWPGNVRELRNVVERAVILTPCDPITAAALREVSAPQPTRTGGGETSAAVIAAGTPATYPIDIARDATLEEALQQAERRHLETALAAEGWNVTRTAVRLGLDRTHCHRKIRAHGIRRPSTDR
jgi:DNA-binding NtrC family response regulator